MFDFSVIVPVHDAAPYVDEALQSVADQSIGLGGTQVVVVDDGSTDGSREACRAWARREPGHVVLVEQERAGVSAARNAGLAHARGRLVVFLDADDKLGPRLLERALDFFERHPDVHALNFPSEFFEAQDGPHPLARKNTATRVVDLEREPDAVCLSTRGMVFRAEALAGARFDEGMRYSEDALFTCEVLLGLGRFGMSADERYWYRKRSQATSALDGARRTREYYLHTPDAFYGALMRDSAKKHGRVVAWVQHCVMYDLQWRLRQPVQCDGLSPEELASYRQTVVDLLGHIDDAVLAKQRDLDTRQRIYALAVKRGRDPDELCATACARGKRLCVQGVAVQTLAKVSGALKVTTIERTSGGVRLEGFSNTLADAAGAALEIRFFLDERELPASFAPWPHTSSQTPFHGDALARRGFTVDVPWQGGKARRLTARVSLCGTPLRARFAFGAFAGLCEHAEGSFLALCGVTLRHVRDEGGEAIVLERASGRRARASERELQERLASDPATAHLAAWRAVGASARTARRRGQTWLIADHTYRAGDNGEALYRYLCAHPVPGVRPVFALSFSSPDFPRLRSYGGELVDFDADAAREALFSADLYLTSSADKAVVKPFGAERAYLADLLRYKSVFLQHGVTKDDLSRWLHRQNQHFSLFLCAAAAERRSILEGGYGYAPDQVALTGFPRHDLLLEQAALRPPGRLLLIMPTWRKPLAHNVEGTDEKRLAAGFAASSFYRFWQDLIASPRLDEALASHDATALFVPHPAFASAAGLFHGTDRVQVAATCDYAPTYARASCLLTDYSSTALDFGLLRRPIAYAQFDAQTFFAQHTYGAGYYSYERDGLGPVCSTLEETLDAVEAMLDADGVMAPVWRERADAFYFEPAGSRCEAVVQAALRLSGR